jgi:hypothetical protein
VHSLKRNITEERDALIHKMISIAGLEAINIESLEIDSDYTLSHTSEPKIWD